MIEWSFGDDSATQTGASVAHIFSQPGTYQVSVRVTVDGQVATKLLLVQVTAAPLAARVAVDQIETVEGLEVRFDASPSTGPVREVQWDFGDGTFGTGYTPTHIYATSGTYQVQVKVLGVSFEADTKPVSVKASPKGPVGLLIKNANTGAPLAGG
jgi:PKD repeat protein